MSENHLNGKSDLALPAWLVTEYVYNPDGTFVGLIRQRHQMQVLSDGNIRVTITCEPEFTGHALARLKGDWTFDLGREYGKLIYHGPDIIGTGRSWGERTLTTVGEWGRVGYVTAAYSVVIEPDRQIVGSRFDATTALRPLTFDSNRETAAKTVGIASPEIVPDDWPVFAGPTWPGMLSEYWSGTWHSYNERGELVYVTDIERRYQDDSWEEFADGHQRDHIHIREPDLLRLPPAELAHTPHHFHRYGWGLEFTEGISGQHQTERVEVLDCATETLTGFRRTVAFDTPQREIGVDVVMMKPRK